MLAVMNHAFVHTDLIRDPEMEHWSSKENACFKTYGLYIRTLCKLMASVEHTVLSLSV